MILNSNHRNPEEFLLNSENIDTTIRLLQAGAFEVDDPGATQQLQQLMINCPNLVQQFLPVADFIETPVEDIGEDEEVQSEGISGNERQTKITVIGRVKANHVEKQWKLPTRPSQMTETFRRALRVAYLATYGDNISHFVGSFTYWNKFAFTDRYVNYSYLSNANSRT